MKLLTAITAGFIGLSTFVTAPAIARPSSCWWGAPNSTRMSQAPCDVTRRINSNGHVVWDVIDDLGDKFSVVLWRNGTAEVFFEGERTNVTWRRDSDGDVRILTPKGYSIAFRPA